LIEQTYWSLVKNLNDLCNRYFHDVQNHFVRVNRSLDEALAKSASVSKSKEQECFEAQNELTSVGTCFAHSSLDYIYQMNLMHATKKYKITEAFLSYIRACETYFHQGYDLFGDEWSKTKDTLNDQLTRFKNEERQVEKKMQDRHAIVPKEIFEHPPGMPLDPEIVVEGYLFKRSSKAIKTWHRRWFMVRDNKFLYCHRESFTVMESDLRLCLVRPLPASFDRRNLRISLLFSDSESLCLGWIKALQRTIESALHDCSISEVSASLPLERDPQKNCFSIVTAKGKTGKENCNPNYANSSSSSSSSSIAASPFGSQRQTRQTALPTFPILCQSLSLGKRQMHSGTDSFHMFAPG
uniref:PH domain-containing protein n=1 Tax=Soboliphyme baturini TaxID=241478 RepID=A0A183IZ47_9BILA